jgi:hypothetical protein
MWKRNPVTSNYTTDELIIGGVIIVGGLFAISQVFKSAGCTICKIAHAPGTAVCSLASGAGSGVNNFFNNLFGGCPFSSGN